MGHLTGLVLFLSVAIVTVKCVTYPECDNVFETKFVSSSKGCSSYIYCDGENSYDGTCGEELVFNALDSSCDDASNVDCDDQSSTTQTTLIPTTVTTPTTTVTTPINTAWPPSSGVSSTTTAVSSTSTLTPATSPDGQIICPQPSKPDEVIYLPDPNSCSNYYMCYRLNAIPMTCPNDLQFNSLTGSCDWAQTANCRVAVTTTLSPREVCATEKFGYQAYPSNCHYYYRCTNGLLIIQECPNEYGWDVSRKMCTNTKC